MITSRFNNLDFIPASHEDPNDPGCMKKVLFTFKDLVKGQIMMINWSTMRPGKSFSPHYHEDMDEVFIIIKGKVKMRVDEEFEELEKGDGVITPHGSIHEMWNIGEEDVDYIALGISLEQGGKTINV